MAAPAEIAKTPLRSGMGGKLVTQWQQLLRRKGFVLSVDGIFGPKTLSATKAAQAWAGLKPGGVVGPKTWTAVEKKTRSRRPLSTARALAGRPKIIDARQGRAGFPYHRYKRWGTRPHVNIVVGHYTGGPASFLADATFHVKSSYLDEGGAPAIAYHLGVDKDGTLFVFNDWQSVTWHCDGGKNTATLGIVFRGATEGPTLAQQKTLKWLLRSLGAGSFRPVKSEPAWPQIRVTTTHRHVKATSCPGAKGEAFYRANPAGRFVTGI